MFTPRNVIAGEARSLFDSSEISDTGNSYEFTSVVNSFGHFWKPDGTKIFFAGNQSPPVDATFKEYSLSRAYDVTSTITLEHTEDIGDKMSAPSGVYISPDGLNIYTVDYLDDEIVQYAMSTAWDLSTISFVREISALTEDANPRFVWFKSDGSKMYMKGEGSNAIYQYSISPAWNISNPSYDSVTLDFSVVTTIGRSFFITENGKYLFLAGAFDDIFVWELGTPWNLGTASRRTDLDSTFDFGTILNSTMGGGISWSSDGRRLFVCDLVPPEVFEFDTIDI